MSDAPTQTMYRMTGIGISPEYRDESKRRNC